MVNKHKILGICTDGRTKNGKPIIKKGKQLYGATGWYRIFNPLAKLGATIRVGLTVRVRADDAMRLKEMGDIWVMKMADNDGIDHIYGAHKDFTGAKLVLDLDDDIDNVDVSHPEFDGLKERLPMRIRMVKMADHIIAATQQIKENIKHLNPYCTVIPNSIDPAIWKYENKLKDDGKIRIGWMSSGSHFVDTPIIEGIMLELLEEYPNLEFHMAGMVRGSIKGKRWFHHHGTVGYDTFPKFYASLGIDISIAPLKDIMFNRCKSNIKFLEASMLAIPTVASDVLPYQCIQHGRTGYLASNSQQFKKYLKILIEDKNKREEMGKAAKQYVLDNWTIDKFLPKYEELFDKITEKKDISVITAITGGKDNLLNQPEYKGVEYVAFTDTDIKSEQWKARKACDKFAEPVMNSKIHKILSHKYVDTPYIVWMDGNCSLKQDPHKLVELMGDKDYAFFKHPGRDCLYDESERCVELHKGKVEEIAEQNTDYARMNFPSHAGLCECTCFIRKNNPKANATFEKWWVEITRYSNRDQISFPVAFQGKEWETIPGTIADATKFKNESEATKKMFPGNDYFHYTNHNFE